MQRWKDLVQVFYYAGASIVLLGTGVRFFYRTLRGLIKHVVEELVDEKLQSLNPSHPENDGQD